MNRIFYPLVTLFFISLFANLGITAMIDKAGSKGIELINKRTEFNKVYTLKNKTYALYSSVSPIHYKDNYNDKYETWKNIDLTFNNNVLSKAPYILEINNNSYTIMSKKSGKSLTIAGVGQVKPMVYGFKLVRKLNSIIDVVSTEFNISGDLDGFKIEAHAKDAEGKVIEVEYLIRDGKLIENILPENLISVVYPITIDPTIIDIDVDTSSNDGYEREDTGEVDNNQDILDIRSATTAIRRFGCIIWDVAITQGWTINTAYATVNSTSAGNDCNFAMHFEDSSNPSTIEEIANNITDRTLTSNSSDWIELNIGEGLVNTPSLVTPLQEIADSYNTSSVALLIMPYQDIYRATAFSAYDDADGTPPSLYIEYTEEEAEEEQFIPKVIFFTMAYLRDCLSFTR